MARGDNACSAACGYCGRCTDGPAPNATCSDCGARFYMGRDDFGGSLCDACCEKRDAHTSALETRMAKARLKAAKKAIAS